MPAVRLDGALTVPLMWSTPQYTPHTHTANVLTQGMSLRVHAMTTLLGGQNSAEDPLVLYMVLMGGRR